MSYRAGYAAVVGRPNVGKSSLINRFIGQKLNITSHKPQTTRHSILGIKSLDEGQIVYVDTPGIHQRGKKAMNRYLNRTAHTALLEVDVVVFVVQAGVWSEEDALVLSAIKKLACPVLLAVNKIDLVTPREKLLPFLQQMGERHAFGAVIPVSAKKGDNATQLEQEILSRLPEGDPIFPDDQLSDRPERFFASELIREQIIRRYHRELPYAVTVEIEKFEEEDGRINIGAVIWVERDSQRGILIGKQGEALKNTGINARESLEAFFEMPVYLKLWVKVKKSWSSDEKSLGQLGYAE